MKLQDLKSFTENSHVPEIGLLALQCPVYLEAGIPFLCLKELQKSVWASASVGISL